MSPGSKTTGASGSFEGVSVYLDLADEALLAQCSVDTFRASGPGGQKRNKTDSAVRLRHGPTGLQSQAFESRSQHENRARALQRLRVKFALERRAELDPARFEPRQELAALLFPARGQRIGQSNPKYWPAIAQLLDLFVGLACSVSETAKVLGVSTGALSRVLVGNEDVRLQVNRLRVARGLRPLTAS